MSLTHKSFDEYRKAVAPRLDEEIAARRDTECEIVLAHAFLLFSYVIEDMQSKATKDRAILDTIGIMLVELQDVLRGVVHGMGAVSPVVLGSLLRVAFEVRCNFEFITSRAEPARYADRYSRFGRVSELAHDEQLPPDQRRVKPETRAEIVAECGEWIRIKTGGGLHFDHDWNAEKEFSNLKKRALAIGLADDYLKVYGATSQYVHGTMLLWNGYRGPDGKVGPLGSTAPCRRMALLAVYHCMHTLRTAAEFFGLPFDEAEYLHWRVQWVASSEQQNAATCMIG